MIISISQPIAFSHTGMRPHNEDCLFPRPETLTGEERLFMVCDGVGGAEKGEVASALACESIDTYFRTFLEAKPVSSSFIQKAIQYTETCFDACKEQHPEAEGMATTLALVYFDVTGVWLAHLGDSRIYQIRNGQIIYRTEDHSLVNMLVKSGQISEEEASVHPRRHVILRAIQGSGRPSEADTAVLTDIQAGDIFFLCSDGVTEHCQEKDFPEIFSGTAGDAKDRILERCWGRTKDNYSFYILPVQHVQEKRSLKQNILSFLYSFP